VASASPGKLPHRAWLTLRHRGLGAFLFRSLTFPLRATRLRERLGLPPVAGGSAGIAHPTGDDGSGLDRSDVRRARLLERLRIDLIVDAGANIGQYATEVRRSGYAGRIVSFEPLSAPFSKLVRLAAADPRWECRQAAVGDRDGWSTINVAGNDGQSSSFLEMLDRHVQAAQESAYVGRERVWCARLDSLLASGIGESERVWLKLDVQGHEVAALAGARRLLPRVAAIEAELSLVPLYRHQPLFREVIDYLEREGFGLVGLVPGFSDPRTGELLQMDGIFVRQDERA
jgi:FkbM family methyltransferase